MSIRKAVKKTRDRVLGNLSERLEHLENQVETISHTQLQINHNVMTALNEINDRTKNSGTVHLSSSEMATKLFSGLKIYVDPQDLTLSVHLALDSIWESDITAAWLQVVKDNDVVVDIGANYGYFGALAAQKVGGPKSHFVFFEANPYLMPYIKKTLAANWLIDRCSIENLAVSDKPGTVSLSVSSNYLGNASLHGEGDKAYDPYRIRDEKMEVKKVAAVTLDDYCATKGIKALNLIKIDIEGHEQVAYDGMRQIIKKSPDISMFIEFTANAYQNPKKFYDQMLKDFGNVYTIAEGGRIVKPKSNDYAHVVNKPDAWVMPIFSKNPRLHLQK